MTSKEALEKIKKIEILNAIDKWGCPETIYFEEAFDFESEKGVDELLKIIEKDLEVLEIIRSHTPSIMRLNICNTVIQYNKIYIDNNPLQNRILNEDEFKLLKEWLNENNQ